METCETSDQLPENKENAAMSIQFGDEAPASDIIEHFAKDPTPAEQAEEALAANEKGTTKIEAPAPSIDDNDKIENGGVSDFDRQSSEATNNSDSFKMTQLDIIASNSSSYDSVELASTRAEAARSHQSQHASEEPSSPPRPLSSSNGMSPEEYEEFVLRILNVNICKNQKDRQTVEWIESQLTEFMVDEATSYKRFEEMTSYHRMLVHRVAEYYRLYHHVDQSGKCVVVSKQHTHHAPLPPSSASIHQGGGGIGNNGTAAQQATAGGMMASPSGSTGGHHSRGGGGAGEGGEDMMTSPNSATQHSHSSSTTSSSQNNNMSHHHNSYNSSSNRAPPSGNQRYPNQMDFRGNNPGYYTPDSNSIMAGTGLASGQQGSFRRKPNTLPLNKRLNAPYKEQVNFSGPRKPSGGYQVPPNQGIGRYGASFENSSSRPNINNSNSQAPQSFRNRAPNQHPPAAKALRFPNSKSVPSLNTMGSNFGAGGPMSISSNAPFAHMFNPAVNPMGNLQQFNYFAGQPRAPMGMQESGLLGAPPMGSPYSLLESSGPQGANQGQFPAGVPLNWILAQQHAGNPAGAMALLNPSMLSAQMAAASTLNGLSIAQSQMLQDAKGAMQPGVQLPYPSGKGDVPAPPPPHLGPYGNMGSGSASGDSLSTTVSSSSANNQKSSSSQPQQETTPSAAPNVNSAQVPKSNNNETELTSNAEKTNVEEGAKKNSVDSSCGSESFGVENPNENGNISTTSDISTVAANGVPSNNIKNNIHMNPKIALLSQPKPQLQQQQSKQQQSPAPPNVTSAASKSVAGGAFGQYSNPNLQQDGQYLSQAYQPPFQNGAGLGGMNSIHQHQQQQQMMQLQQNYNMAAMYNQQMLPRAPSYNQIESEDEAADDDVQGATAAMAGLRMQSNGGANALAASSPLMFNSSVAAANQARSNPGGAQNQPWMSQAATAQQRAELANAMMNMASMNGGAGGAHGGAGGQVLTMNRDGSYHNSAIIPNFNHNQLVGAGQYGALYPGQPGGPDLAPYLKQPNNLQQVSLMAQNMQAAQTPQFLMNQQLHLAPHAQNTPQYMAPNASDHQQVTANALQQQGLLNSQQAQQYNQHLQAQIVASSYGMMQNAQQNNQTVLSASQNGAERFMNVYNAASPMQQNVQMGSYVLSQANQPMNAAGPGAMYAATGQVPGFVPGVYGAAAAPQFTSGVVVSTPNKASYGPNNTLSANKGAGYNGVNNNSNARSPKIESAVAESSPYKPNGGNLKEGGNSASAVSKD